MGGTEILRQLFATAAGDECREDTSEGRGGFGEGGEEFRNVDCAEPGIEIREERWGRPREGGGGGVDREGGVEEVQRRAGGDIEGCDGGAGEGGGEPERAFVYGEGDGVWGIGEGEGGGAGFREGAGAGEGAGEGGVAFGFD